MTAAPFARALFPLAAAALAACGAPPEPPRPPEAPPAAPAPPSSSPAAAPTASATPASTAPAAPSGFAPMPPHLVKDYHVAVCFVLGYTVRAERDLYVASLGGAKPSARQRPQFLRSPIPPDRIVKHCRLAMKDEGDPRPQVDAAVKAYTALAEDIAGALSELTDYYDRRGSEQDGFARGLALHGTLLAVSPKLDAAHAALGAAIAAHQQAHPAVLVSQHPDEPIARRAVEEALIAVELLFAGKIDGARYTRSVEQIAQATESLRATEPPPPAAWKKIMGPPLEAFVQAARAFTPAAGKPIDQQARAEVCRAAWALVESRGRAIARIVQFARQ